MTTAPIGVIGHYNLLEKLDPMGPGDLYRARDTRAGRTVAIRVLPGDFLPDAPARAALVQRARGVLSLSHPNTTTLFDVAEHDARVYLVFEFLKGRSLRAEMGGRMLNVRRAVEIAIQIADAVADAHAAGFLHGGLSPESVVVTEKGHAKIPAMELSAREGFEQGRADIRLRDYDAPEETRGEPPDDRSDVYSVGAMLYEMLTGRRPSHRGASAPSATNADVSAELDNVTLRAVAPNPDLRYPAMAALASALRHVLALVDTRGEADDEGGVESRASAHVGKAVVFAGVLLAVVAFLGWLFTRS